METKPDPQEIANRIEPNTKSLTDTFVARVHGKMIRALAKATQDAPGSAAVAAEMILDEELQTAVEHALSQIFLEYISKYVKDRM